jgi:hypothetical protein
MRYNDASYALVAALLFGRDDNDYERNYIDDMLNECWSNIDSLKPNKFIMEHCEAKTTIYDEDINAKETALGFH